MGWDGLPYREGVFEGDFRNGKYDGDGKMTYLNGVVLIAQYRAGLLDGPCTMRLTDGGLLRGEFHYGVADGHWSSWEPKASDTNGN